MGSLWTVAVGRDQELKPVEYDGGRKFGDEWEI